MKFTPGGEVKNVPLKPKFLQRVLQHRARSFRADHGLRLQLLLLLLSCVAQLALALVAVPR
jgi:hypothetical protein